MDIGVAKTRRNFAGWLKHDVFKGSDGLCSGREMSHANLTNWYF
jgi:hypothetical protein